MVILLSFHLHTLTPLTGSRPSLTKTLNEYLTGRQKCPQPGQTARTRVEGISCGRVLVVVHFQGHADDSGISEPEVTSRRLRGFILRTFWIMASDSTNLLSTIMKFFVIRSRAFRGRTCFLHKCGSGDAKIVITKEARKMEIWWDKSTWKWFVSYKCTFLCHCVHTKTQPNVYPSEFSLWGVAPCSWKPEPYIRPNVCISMFCFCSCSLLC